MKFAPTIDPIGGAWLRNGALGGAVLGAVLLLTVFYAVVAGAVERGASRRADSGASTAVMVAGRSQPAVRATRIARVDE